MAYCKILLPDGVTELANIKSVTFREAVNSGVDLLPGCVGSASIEVEVYNTQPNAVSAGDALTYYQIDKNNAQTLIGVFYAEPVIATKNSYKFVAYDAANKLNADFSAWLMANQSNFPMTIYALVSAACTVAGVTLGSSSWTLSTETVEAFYADRLTCRDILSYAAELGCKFVRCHSDGKVYFDWYATATNKRIYPSAGVSGSETRYAYKQDGLQYANYTTAAIDGVAVHPSGEDDVAYIYPSGASGNLLHITNNLLLTGADASFYNAAAQAVYTALNTLGTYRPATANLFPKENPFRVGDVVAVTDAQSVSFTTVIMEQTVNESDAVLSSTGNENYSDAEYNTQKAITQLASDVVRINKLKVDWADINTAIINYLTANDVTAQNLTIVDANDNVLATFNANGITLGQTGQSRMELDHNSLELYDQDGNLYTSIGDFRDANGYATLTETKLLDSASTVVTVEFPIYSVSSVTIDGVATTAYTPKTPTDKSITFANSISANSIVVIEYVTEDPVYHFDFGTRKSGENIGGWSTANGCNQTASATFATVSGGINNSAIGVHATIGGGGANEANTGGSVGGGVYNRAVGKYAAVAGGFDNDATGSLSAVAGGQKNVASGVSSFAANEYNEAKGAYSVALGRANKASGNSQTAIGKFCVEDNANTYAEIVGNGTADNARSNARTLDWNGNEWIAGALSVGDAGTTRANLGDVYGAQVEITSGTHDLNDYTTAGLYYFKATATLTNAPLATADGWLTVYVSSNGNYIKQVFQREGNVSGTYKGFYIRLCGNGTWSAWSQVAVGLPLGLGDGGTGATTASAAKANLGLDTLSFDHRSASNGGTAEIPLESGSHGVIFVTSASSNGHDILLFNVNTGGGVGYTRVRNATGLTITTTTNKLSIANSTGVYIYAGYITW